MLLLLLLSILVLVGILPGVYQSLKHILGWKMLQGKTQRYLEQSGVIIFLLRAGLFMFSFFFILSIHTLVIGIGVLFAFLNILILKWLERRQRSQKPYRRVLVSGFLAGAILFGLWVGGCGYFPGQRSPP